jgi:hypothetical protein
MKPFFKKTLITLSVIAFIASLGYGGYRLYDYAVKEAIARIKKSVRAQVRSGILSTINPLTWPGKIFGHHKDDDSVEPDTPASDKGGEAS